jgi:hemerythrin-like domain-containing protein
MTRATDALLNDHKMIRKILTEFRVENPRFPAILVTLRRVVLGHAWFEDVVFLPALERAPLLDGRFTAEIVQEHKDIDGLLRALRDVPPGDPRLRDALALQLRSLLDAHFAKEENALFPIAERVLEDAGLNALGAEMERRKKEVVGLGDD